MIIPYKGVAPVLASDVFVDQTALVVGDVEIGAGSSVWFYSVIRGDVNFVRIGEKTNVQDSCVVHVTHKKWPTHIGSETTLGHRVIAHGCTIGDRCLVGMGAVVLDGAEVGDNCIVGAAALVPPGMKVPGNSLLMGVPGKIVREIKSEDRDSIRNPVKEYALLAKEYKYRNCNR